MNGSSLNLAQILNVHKLPGPSDLVTISTQNIIELTATINSDPPGSMKVCTIHPSILACSILLFTTVWLDTPSGLLDIPTRLAG